MMNVREREGEIGILRAIGHGSAKIAGLFLGKAALVGVAGAVVGYGVGTALAMSWGPEMFRITSKMITPLYGLLGWCVIGAVVLAGLSAFIPAMVAVTQDPAVTLRKE
jgi:putative ABC transport system permease protein